MTVIINGKKHKKRNRKKEAERKAVKDNEKKEIQKRKRVYNTVNYFDPDDNDAVKKKYRKQKVVIVKVPFDINGNMVSFVEKGKENLYAWRNVEPFRATMQVIKKIVIKNTYRMILMDLHTKVEYTMTMGKFLEMVDYATIIKGQVRGDFFATKHAQGHTLVYLRDYTQWET